MKLKSITAIFILLLSSLLACNASALSSVDVDFTFKYRSNNTIGFTGSFSGFDNNSDGLLSLTELTSFDALSRESGPFNLGEIIKFGDFDYNSNQWLDNAGVWGPPYNHYHGPNPGNYVYPDTWLIFSNCPTCSGASAIASGRGIYLLDTSVKTTVDVPEPPMALLLFTGLAFLFARKRKYG